MMDQFRTPGSEFLNPQLGQPSKKWDDILIKKSAGAKPRPSAAPKKNPEPEPELETWDADPAPNEPADETPSTEHQVKLTNLKWSLEEGTFCEKVTVSAQGELPSDISHITRVQFYLFALSPDGTSESLDKKDGHLKDGKAEAEFTLYYPSFKEDGRLPSKCDFRFTAKHKYSQEEESKPLLVSEAGKLPDYDPGSVEDGEWGCHTVEPVLFDHDSGAMDSAFLVA